MTKVKIITNHEVEDTDRCEEERMENPIPRSYKEKYIHPDFFDKEETLMAPVDEDDEELKEAEREERLVEIEDLLSTFANSFDESQDQYNQDDDGDNASQAFEAYFEPWLSENSEEAYDKIRTILEGDGGHEELLSKMENLFNQDGERFISDVVENLSIYMTSMSGYTYFSNNDAIFQTGNEDDQWEFSYSDIEDHDIVDMQTANDDDNEEEVEDNEKTVKISDLMDELYEIATLDEISDIEKSINRHSNAHVEIKNGEIDISGISSWTMYVLIDVDELTGAVNSLAEELGLGTEEDSEFEEKRKKGLLAPEEFEKSEIVYSLPDGFYAVNLLTESELKDEGRRLGICVGRFPQYLQGIKRGDLAIWSIRTPTGKSRFTVELAMGKYTVKLDVSPDLVSPQRWMEVYVYASSREDAKEKAKKLRRSYEQKIVADSEIIKINQIKGKGNRVPGLKGSNFSEYEFLMIEDFIKSLGINPRDVGDMRYEIYNRFSRKSNPRHRIDDEHCAWCTRAR